MKQNKSFIEILDENLQKKEITPPVFDRTGLQIQQKLATETPDIKAIEKLITCDQTLTSGVLRMANSAFFRGISKISTVRDAIVRLGMNQTANIALLSSQKNMFQTKDPSIKAILTSIWKHSVGCAMGAHWIATTCNLHSKAQEAFTAGLLHDMGKLYILSIAAELIRTQQIDPKSYEVILKEAINTLHGHYGYTLLHLWNIPEMYAIVARDHHMEEFDPKNDLLVIIRLADLACNKLGVGTRERTNIILAASSEADHLGLSEIKTAELEIRIEDAIGLAS
ncbi:MAG: HDOD domain-containing protein [Desulfobulbaceae bacterium]|nr:HDOD domain-containing protein [Desulfobulbaceae bacterium]